jgi:hypothetical protein
MTVEIFLAILVTALIAFFVPSRYRMIALMTYFFFTLVSYLANRPHFL